MSRHRPFGLFGLICLFVATTAQAQARKPPELGYVFPPVVTAGRATSVTLGGYDWTNDLDWHGHRAGMTLTVTSPPGDYFLTPRPYWIGPRASFPPAPIPREVQASWQVAADVPPGPVRWQVANANGASGSALVWVTDRPEIEQIEARSRDLPQRLPTPPVAVSGRLSRLTEVDRYEFVPDREGLHVVELWARRLGSDFQGFVELRDDTGQLVADFADTEGKDGLLAFSAQAGRTYTASVYDVDFRGDRSYIYRLLIEPGPRVLATLPTAVLPGSTVETEFLGWGVATGAARLESLRVPVTIPAGISSPAHRHTLSTPAGATTAVIRLADRGETPLTSLSVNSAGAFDLPGAAIVSGHWPRKQAELRFAWDAAEKQTWSVSLQSETVGGSLDLRLTILDPEGQPLAEVDDLPGSTDAAYEFTTTKAGRYGIVARTLTPLSGLPTELFRLNLQPRTADFTLSHASQRLLVPLGKKGTLKVDAVRSGGFAGPIVLKADGFPKGVLPVGDWLIPEGQASATVSFEAAPDAEVVSSVVRITGSAMVNEVLVSRPVLVPATGNLAPRGEDQRVSEMLLAVTMEPPFEIKVVDRERQREVHRGTTYLAELEIVRQEGFTGALAIAMTARQDRDRQGIRGPLFEVPDGAERVLYPVTMPEWLSTDLTRRIVVHGIGNVADPRGRLRELTAAADARVTMIMEGALLKLACEAREPFVTPGETLELPVRVSRSPKLPLETRVELVVPEELTGIVTADPVELPPGTDSGTLTIRTQRDPRLTGEWKWELRATALEGGRWPVVSVTDVNVLVRE